MFLDKSEWNHSHSAMEGTGQLCVLKRGACLARLRYGRLSPLVTLKESGKYMLKRVLQPGMACSRHAPLSNHFPENFRWVYKSV